MRVSEVRYERTFNLGDYENVKLAATVEVDEGDDPADAWALAKAEVAAQAKPVLDWRDKRRKFEVEHVVDGLPAHLREPVKAMLSMGNRATMEHHNGNGKE